MNRNKNPNRSYSMLRLYYTCFSLSKQGKKRIDFARICHTAAEISTRKNGYMPIIWAKKKDPVSELPGLFM